jgi:putative ABC transport system permease protein
VLAEFSTLGALSGLLAALGASVAAYFLTTQWLDLRYRFGLLPWVVGVLGGTLLVATSGWLATRRVIDQPPLLTLRA